MPQYQVQVLELGFDTAFPAGVAFDFEHMQDVLTSSCFALTLLRGEGHTILFDSGIDPYTPFAQEKIALENDQNCHDTAQVLRSVGVDPAQVDSVILSHCHWDHIGGMRFLPNATFYIQREEVEQWDLALANADLPDSQRRIIDPDDMTRLHDYIAAGRVVLLDGDIKELFPGISICAASGHSYLQNILLLDCSAGRYAIMGDAAMRPENFTGTSEKPGFIPNLKYSVGPLREIIRSYRTVMDWVGGDVSHIVATHDGTRRKRLPTFQSSLGLDVTTICE